MIDQRSTLLLPTVWGIALGRLALAGRRLLARAGYRRVVLLLAALLHAPVALADYEPSITWLNFNERFHVRSDASTVKTVELLIRIETEAGVSEFAERRIQFSASLEKLEILEAWTQTQEGKRWPVAPDKIRTLEATDEGAPEFSDAKVQVVIFPAVDIKAELYLRYRVTQHTPYFPGHATWSRLYPPGAPIVQARVEISHDVGVPLKVLAGGSSGAGSPVGGRVPALADDLPGTVRYAYNYRQDTAHPPETRRVALSDFAPFVLATTFADRAALAAAYQAQARPKAEPTDAVRKLAAELTQDATTEREKVRRLYHWVSRHIRYVALEVGTSGFIPNPAQSILDHRYGDCKDHVVLLEALLRAVGIESSPALVNSQRSMRLPDLAVLGPFDHVITFVPSLDLYLDSTARLAPFAALPAEVQDKPVLLTATGREARTPPSSPSADYTHTRIWMQVSDTGEVWGSSAAVMRGFHELESRSAHFHNLGRRQEDLVRRYLSRYGETGTGRLEPGDPIDLNQPWEVKATFALDPVVKIPGPSAMPIPVGLAPGEIRDLATTRPPSGRRFAYVCTSGRHHEEVELRLPWNASIEHIPDGVTFEHGPLRYASAYRRSGNLVLITREISIDRKSHTCTVRDDEDWAALLRVLQRDLRGQVFIR
jgi:transglutaminase-like putative cysteine protease